MIDKDKITDELLQDLIDKCEDKMASGYKSKADEKKALLVVEEPEDESEVTEKEGSEEIDPEQMEKLLELYKSVKG